MNQNQNQTDAPTDAQDQTDRPTGQPPSAEDIAIGDLMDVSPQDRGVSLARALLDETDGDAPPAARTETALQAAQARQNQARQNLERAQYVARMHEVAVKTLQEVGQQRTYINQAATDLGQSLTQNGHLTEEGDAPGESDD